MKISDFDYILPKNLIAQEPASPRDTARLLVLEKKTGEIKHKHFFDLVDYLHKGDILVVNNSKVFPARLSAKKEGSGGIIEIFLHRRLSPDAWECLIRGKVKPTQELILAKNLKAIILEKNSETTWVLKFNLGGDKLMKLVFQIGQTPLPPYIKREFGKKQKKDELNYQTIYADSKKVGSVAAPTAGLHFTPQLLKKVKKKGVKVLEVTLHVGLGTFAPIKTDNILKHQMHSEWVEVKRSVISELVQAKKDKKRIVAVGTTSVRSLETLFSKKRNLILEKDFQTDTSIFIYPGYKFKVVDALITNFHLPKSTLLLLVSALAGKDNIQTAYQEAINRDYRFFSYGDAMLIY